MNNRLYNKIINNISYAIKQIRRNVNKNTCFTHASDYIKELFKY